MTIPEYILKIIKSRFYDLYETKLIDTHIEKARTKEIKGWWEQGSHKKCEEARQKLLIDSCLQDKIPQLEERIGYVLGNSMYWRNIHDTVIKYCNNYLAILNKLKNKKKFTYKDTYKVDDILAAEPKDGTSKVKLTDDSVIAYIENSLGRPDFKKKLLETIEKDNLIGALTGGGINDLW